MKHLVFYDGECGLCDRTVQFLLKADKKEIFAFAALQGETAKKMLKDLPDNQKNVDSVILIEDWQTNPCVYIRSKAVFRMLWLLGGGWAILGLLNFLPAILFDWGYCLIARNRHRLFSKTECPLPNPQTRHRFLD